MAHTQDPCGGLGLSFGAGGAANGTTTARCGWRSLKKLTYELPCDSVIPRPGPYPRSACVSVDGTLLCKSPKLGATRMSAHR